MKSLLKKTNKKSGSIVSYRVSVLEAKSTLLLSELNIAGVGPGQPPFWSGMKMKLENKTFSFSSVAERKGSRRMHRI